MTRERAILLLSAGGFVLLGAEARYLHRDVVLSQWQGWIPVVAAGAGILGCALVVAKSPKVAAVGRLLLGSVTAASLYGAWLHTEGDLGKFRGLLDVWILAPSRLAQVWPPVGAPLSLAGLALTALVAGWPDRRGRR